MLQVNWHEYVYMTFVHRYVQAHPQTNVNCAVKIINYNTFSRGPCHTAKIINLSICYLFTSTLMHRCGAIVVANSFLFLDEKNDVKNVIGIGSFSHGT